MANMFPYEDSLGVKNLLGKKLKSIERITWHDSDALLFTTEDDEVYVMTHIQDCCENVDLHEIIGELDDLIDATILMAEEVVGDKDLAAPLYPHEESFTWTFYKFATIKGYVTLRWYGSSNGYYSESVNFFLKMDN